MTLNNHTQEEQIKELKAQSIKPESKKIVLLKPPPTTIAKKKHSRSTDAMADMNEMKKFEGHWPEFCNKDTAENLRTKRFVLDRTHKSEKQERSRYTLENKIKLRYIYHQMRNEKIKVGQHSSIKVEEVLDGIQKITEGAKLPITTIKKWTYEWLTQRYSKEYDVHKNTRTRHRNGPYLSTAYTFLPLE